LPADTNQHVLVPHPTGEVRTPPRDAAVIQIVPGPFAEPSSVGTRYFVTPSLAGDKAYHYVVVCRWNQGGQMQ
jgi:hypothetical protein